MVSLLQLLFFVLLRLTQSSAFSGGPPLSRCEQMIPFHAQNSPQSGAAPFTITWSNTSGDELEVNITADSGHSFKGFILQARANENSISWPVGQFEQIPSGARYLYCAGGDPKNTVGHNNTAKTSWTSRQFRWRPPAKSAGNVTFWATVVEQYDTFWTYITSDVVPRPPAENVTRGYPSSSVQINKTGCNETKGCYSIPSSCTGSNDCLYLLTYKVSGGNVTIEMSAKERWASVAFNEKKAMDKMDAIMCATLGSNLVEVRHYYSHSHDVIRRDVVGSTDIRLEEIVYEDGGIACRFKRKLTPDSLQSRDLHQKWHLLFAHGTTTPSGSAQYHYLNRTFTLETVNVSKPAILFAVQREPTSPPSTDNQITKDGCDQTKSCHSEPPDCKSSSDCDYLVAYKPVGEDAIEFEVSAKAGWAAIGFNEEKGQMPGTDSLICVDVSGQVRVEHYVADKGYGPPTKKILEADSVNQDFGVSDGGVVRCRFTRKKEVPGMLDLNEEWYLVFASGPMVGDMLGKHDTLPSTSSEKVDLSKITVITAEKEDMGMIQAHGCLMVIAWVGLASIGIFMARYMRMVFGEKQLLGTKVWFTFHRILMVSTVVLTIASIIIIFVHAGRWTKEAGAHPITGIIVLVLAVIQPIMALFRPHPGGDSRYIFNWAHRGAGISALILAVVTIFLGIRLEDLDLDDSALYTMVAYCVGVALVIIFEIYLAVKNVGRASFSTMGGGKDDSGRVSVEPASGQHVSARKLMLVFVVLLVSAVVVAMIVLIASADGEGHQH